MYVYCCVGVTDTLSNFACKTNLFTNKQLVYNY